MAARAGDRRAASVAAAGGRGADAGAAARRRGAEPPAPRDRATPSRIRHRRQIRSRCRRRARAPAARSPTATARAPSADPAGGRVNQPGRRDEAAAGAGVDAASRARGGDANRGAAARRRRRRLNTSAGGRRSPDFGGFGDPSRRSGSASRGAASPPVRQRALRAELAAVDRRRRRARFDSARRDIATSGKAFLSASANSSAVSNRSAGFSASARANAARSADRSAPAIPVKASAACAPMAADPAAPQHFVHQRRQAEDVGAAIPGAARDPLRRGVGTAHRRGDADPLERARDAEAGQPRVVGRRQQHVARMQRAVVDVDDRREVERAGQLRRDAQRVGRRAPDRGRGRRCRASRRRRSPGRDRRRRRRCRWRAARRCPDASDRRRSGARTRRRADARARAAGRA